MAGGWMGRSWCCLYDQLCRGYVLNSVGDENESSLFGEAIMPLVSLKVFDVG
jgi:hypothetical protein